MKNFGFRSCSSRQTHMPNTNIQAHSHKKVNNPTHHIYNISQDLGRNQMKEVKGINSKR